MSSRTFLLDDLPPEIFGEIFSFLPEVDICNQRLINSQFKEIAESNEVWKGVFMRKYYYRRYRNGVADLMVKIREGRLPVEKNYTTKELFCAFMSNFSSPSCRDCENSILQSFDTQLISHEDLVCDSFWLGIMKLMDTIYFGPHCTQTLSLPEEIVEEEDVGFFHLFQLRNSAVIALGGLDDESKMLCVWVHNKRKNSFKFSNSMKVDFFSENFQLFEYRKNTVDILSFPPKRIQMCSCDIVHNTSETMTTDFKYQVTKCFQVESAGGVVDEEDTKKVVLFCAKEDEMIPTLRYIVVYDLELLKVVSSYKFAKDVKDFFMLRAIYMRGNNFLLFGRAGAGNMDMEQPTPLCVVVRIPTISSPGAIVSQFNVERVLASTRRGGLRGFRLFESVMDGVQVKNIQRLPSGNFLFVGRNVHRVVSFSDSFEVTVVGQCDKFAKEDSVVFRKTVVLYNGSFVHFNNTHQEMYYFTEDGKYQRTLKLCIDELKTDDQLAMQMRNGSMAVCMDDEIKVFDWRFDRKEGKKISGGEGEGEKEMEIQEQ